MRPVVQPSRTRTTGSWVIGKRIDRATMQSAGWDPRQDHPSYVFFRVVPRTVQAWGTVPEMLARTLMRDGTWLL